MGLSFYKRFETYSTKATPERTCHSYLLEARAALSIALGSAPPDPELSAPEGSTAKSTNKRANMGKLSFLKPLLRILILETFLSVYFKTHK